MLQTLVFIALPVIVWAVIDQICTSCAEQGLFILIIPIVSALIGVSYCWGRYYANKLDYARTIN